MVESDVGAGDGESSFGGGAAGNGKAVSVFSQSKAVDGGEGGGVGRRVKQKKKIKLFKQGTKNLNYQKTHTTLK